MSCESAGAVLSMREVLKDHDLHGSFLPLSMAMGSADNTELINRCFQVLKAGYITAKGELVIDRRGGAEESLDRCVHLMDVHWFEAVAPLVNDAEATEAG